MHIIRDSRLYQKNWILLQKLTEKSLAILFIQKQKIEADDGTSQEVTILGTL